MPPNDPPDGPLSGPMPDLEWLRTFVVFAEHLNFTRAAAALGLSQPAVHGQVRKLASQLGVTLYQKEGRALALTEAGRAVVGFARDLLQRSARFTAELHGLQHGPVVLAAGEGSLLYLIDEHIRDFARRPGRGVRLLVTDAVGTVAAVRDARAAIGVAPVERPPAAIEAVPIAQVGAQIILPVDHRLAARRTLEPRDLADARLIVPPPGRPLRTAIEALLADVPWTVAVEVRGWPLTLHCVAMGLGLAVVNDCCPPPPGTVGRAFPALPGRAWHAIRRAGVELPPPAEALWTALVDA